MSKGIWDARYQIVALALVAFGALTGCTLDTGDETTIFSPGDVTQTNNQGSGAPVTTPTPRPSAVPGTCPEATASVGVGCLSGDCPATLSVGQRLALNATPKLAGGTPSTCHGPANWSTSDGTVCRIDGASTGLEGFNPDVVALKVGQCVVTIEVDGAAAARTWAVK